MTNRWEHASMTGEAGAALQVLGMDKVIVGVGDFEVALDFYAGSLGLPLTFQEPGMGVASLRLGAEESGLILRAGTVHPQGPRDTPRFWLEVRDARAAATVLRQRGVALMGEPFEVPTGWTVEVCDPWGNVIGLADHTKDPSRRRPAH